MLSLERSGHDRLLTTTHPVRIRVRLHDDRVTPGQDGVLLQPGVPLRLDLDPTRSATLEHELTPGRWTVWGPL